MPKQSVRAEVNNFVQGLITEASPLNFPPNASVDEENYELNRDGTRDRRLGLGMEPEFTYVSVPLFGTQAVSSKINQYKWLGVKGIQTLDFLVVQTEQVLTFFDLSQNSISSAGNRGTLTLSSFPADVTYQFTSIEGTLIAVAGVDTFAIISYDGAAFSVTYDRLKVRDVWGAEEKTIPQYQTDNTYRGGLDMSHIYNLTNQSWGIPRKNSAGTLVDPIGQYLTDLGVYPSSTEVVWTGLQFQPVTAGVTFERIYTNLYQDVLGADIKAAKGYYLIDFLSRGASRMSEFAANTVKHPTMTYGSVVLPTDITAGGARAVTEFAGRAWYGGFSGDVTDGDVRSPNVSNFILFSQLIKNKTDFNKCYQEGDPTSRENSDVIDTDGGFIRISGAKTIISLINLESSLIVVADNGVWSVTGGNDYGFSATNFKVTKISSFGGLSNNSVVIEGGRAFFWSTDGIYVIGKDNLGAFGVVNITQKTIQTLYETIPLSSKINCSSVYDPISKKIRWIYKTGDRFGGDSVTYELVLDTVLNAFYKNRINNLSPNIVEVVGMFASIPFKRGEVYDPVYVETDPVYSLGEAVGIAQIIRDSGIQSTRYLVLKRQGNDTFITFAYYNNIDFIDWEEVDGTGVDAKAFLLTGDQTASDSAVEKQMPYLIMHFKRTENGVTSEMVPDRQSGCLMRCQWDFSNTINSKKWSPLVQVYRYRRALFVNGESDTYDNGFSLVSTRNKVRGRGRAFSLYLETEPRKDCRIIGWSISLNGNTIT